MLPELDRGRLHVGERGQHIGGGHTDNLEAATDNPVDIGRLRNLFRHSFLMGNQLLA